MNWIDVYHDRCKAIPVAFGISFMGSGIVVLFWHDMVHITIGYKNVQEIRQRRVDRRKLLRRAK